MLQREELSFGHAKVLAAQKEREKIKADIEQYLRDIKEELPNVTLHIIGPGGQFEYNGYIPFSMQGAEKAKEIFPWT